MSKHTPGPWNAFPKPKYGEWHVSVPVDGWSMKLGLFPEGVPTGERAEADARLIASSPDLLEACQRAFDQTDKVARPADWEMLRAAIAKATGEQP